MLPHPNFPSISLALSDTVSRTGPPAGIAVPGSLGSTGSIHSALV